VAHVMPLPHKQLSCKVSGHCVVLSCPYPPVLSVDYMSVGTRINYLSIAELVDIFFLAHSRVEVVLWLRAIVRDCVRDRVRDRVDQIILSRIIVASIVPKNDVL
jgi:hypothetical protein